MRRVLRRDFVKDKLVDRDQKSYVKISKQHLLYKMDVLHRKQLCHKPTAFLLYFVQLNNHMKHHLNLREYECPMCFKAFNERPELNRHMKRVHYKGTDSINMKNHC